MTTAPTELLPGLWRFPDTCNVYVLRRGDEAIAIDFGSGRWRSMLPRLGVRKLTHVFLTHHHADQCAGLLARRAWPFQIHAPLGEERYLARGAVKQYWRSRRSGAGWPASYSVLPRGLPGIQYDLVGFSDLYWGNQRLRFVSTPGHGPNALSIILDHDRKQIVFCGDAAHAGGTLWQPYHLEWDHWTGTGALAAWEGVQRLANLGLDLLCPAHGPVITTRPRQTLRRLARRLMELYRVKGQICPGERDHYHPPQFLPCGARRVLPQLCQFGENGYLLSSDTGECLVVDPWTQDLAALAELWRELGRPRITAAVCTHYHLDHSDALAAVRQRYGAVVWLHPTVAIPLRRATPANHPWLPAQPVKPDRYWPARGSWRWNEYRFQIAPFPGQTWWHCAFLTRVDGQRVLFGGDNFQPASRWNGTGGFSSFNGSRFREGFARSAALVLDWKPDLIAGGHQTYYRFHASQFRKIRRWSAHAEQVVQALCPSGDLRQDYHLHAV